MNVMAVKTAESQHAVNAVMKTISKKFEYGVSIKTPDEFIAKRTYMQSDEFINDPHNKHMFNIINELMEYRDGIAKEISSINEALRDKLVQAINGYARFEKDLNNDYSLNFNSKETLETPTQIQYRMIKNVLLKKLSEKAMQK